MAARKAFILGGYQPYAAGYVLYHVGRVLAERFGYEPVVVRTASEGPETSPFRYPTHFATIELRDLEESVRTADLFLPIAAAWALSFGLNLNCRKLLYVQGANMFTVLDGFMDGYVAVSKFVRQTLQHLYDIDAPVICPFIEAEPSQGSLPWESRDPGSAVIFAKPPEIASQLIGAFVARLSARYPDIKLTFHIIERGVPHAVIMELLGRTRYFVGLSPTEGFGLLPLEAMASGCAVTAFHAGGGRDYMSATNSRSVGYPRLDQLVDHFADVFRDPVLAKSLTAQGRIDARQFNRARFDTEWFRYLTEFGA